MDVVVESTQGFEQDLGRLSQDDRAVTVEQINDCARFFPTQKAEVYRKLRHRPLLSELDGYESSLYTLKVSQELGIVLAVDEDPIFGQVILTLFRVVNRDELDRAYQGIAESLYQDLLHLDRETAQVS